MKKKRSPRLSKTLLLLLCSLPVYAASTGHHWRPRQHSWRRSMVSMPEAQTLQNLEIDRLQLPRIVDDSQLRDLVKTGELLDFQDGNITTTVSPDRRYARSWTVEFMHDMGDMFRRRFNKPLYVSSAVRTVEQQMRLRRRNRFAVAQSSHCAGITFDLGKHPLTPQQTRWIANYLLLFRSMGLVIAQEEPYCFHVAVLERYNEFYDQELQDPALRIPE